MKNENSFYRLAGFIQEFIYRHRWEEMRQIQEEACKIIFDTSHHLIIASGTASGKTEAAFFPIITDLYEHPVDSIHTLYISPLKALINDQFLRLNELLEEAYIPVWQWHGDVSVTHKNKLLKDPRGILQITPESLESLLINKSSHIFDLFHNLKFVVIDEIHSFMGTERGFQVLSLISRLSSSVNIVPRKIGLSATLGDYTYAKNWLKSDTSLNVYVCNPPSGNKKVNIALESFKSYNPDNPKEESLDHYEFIYKNTLNMKSIIFTNSRNEAENVIFYLRRFAGINGTIDNFYVHHGSISAMIRKEAETILKDKEKNAVVAATLTLELGIDIGDLHRIVQIGSPHSCSSFVQRLGRSGRKTGKSEILFVDVEARNDKESIYNLHWDLLQTIAIIELYIKEKWLESPKNISYPYSLLYHQTMSILTVYGELTPKDLARRVLTLPPFKKITLDDYRILLNHLIEINHIEKLDNNVLIIGLEGEKIVSSFHFYAVFSTDFEYRVLHNSSEIGTLQSPPEENTTILLSGKSWTVREVNRDNKTVHVVPAKERAKALWTGSSLNIDDRIIRKIKEILLSDEKYPYVRQNAEKEISYAREFIKTLDIENDYLFPLADNTYLLMPWMGSIKMNTLYKFLKTFWKDYLEITSVQIFYSYFLIINSSLDKNVFIEKFHSFVNEENLPSKEVLGVFIDEKDDLVFHKFDRFIPRELRIKAYFEDYLDLGFIKDLK
ncbi:MAG: DEAD/DEAH box helicase [Oscillospiraceae bacterium]|nr:DEAD/DEAH box helicase [Oscillospiraceae bacterium]